MRCRVGQSEFSEKGAETSLRARAGWMDGWFVCGAVRVEGARRHSSGKKGCKTEQWDQLKHMTGKMFGCKRGLSAPRPQKYQIPFSERKGGPLTS